VRKIRRSTPLFVILVALSLIAAACGGGGSKKSASSSDTENVPAGGTLVVSAEQEPDCTDWIGSCSGSSWGYWTLNVTTTPRTFNVVKKGGNYGYEVTDLLQGEPDLKATPQQVITYKINPAAKWSDGQPITSSDFKYVWDQVKNGSDIYDASGYKDIANVDDSNPAVAVVTFDKVYSDWKSLFGGQYGLMPSHLLKGKDRNAEMANGYKWSGGPWMIESWNKGADATLVPNPTYWGTKPKLDKVVYKFITDTSAEFQAFKAGETQVAYPQPQPDAVDQIKGGLQGFKSLYTSETGNLEALWFNNSKAPFNDPKVRQAFGYAIDRNSLVDRLFGPLGVKEPMQTINPTILKDYADPTAWSKYKLDLNMVNQLMTEAGWTKGANGIWAKGGKAFATTIQSTTGNKRRELTEQILQEQLKTAGFTLNIQNQKSGDLFGDILPKGAFEVALYAQVLTSFSPSNCNIFCSANIPQAPKFSGQNWQRVNLPAVDPLLETVDSSLVESVREENNKKADPVLAETNVALPLDPLPNIVLWNSKVVGPVGDNAIMGPFWNMNEWGLKQ